MRCTTLVHEIAHFYGIDDARLHELGWALMDAVASTLPLDDVALGAAAATSGPWQTVVWNDPVNLMSYVSHVFRTYFGFSRERAERLMLAVATTATPWWPGAREQMELHVQAMHDYGLWATVREGGA
jgi:ATP-dependent Clp protease adaptor protein ClpS